ncbi:hypothetical protein DMN91_007716 [Ooceraea biroi]|uniref:Uncharacterized protein n=1 Tax=Ooceraea biroi TaxID=2015173 RepID=A0A3L8DGW1_OOCBI|nr:hypothetical protein DMN91_007716 [Ooceraea biroi]
MRYDPSPASRRALGPLVAKSSSGANPSLVNSPVWAMGRDRSASGVRALVGSVARRVPRDGRPVSSRRASRRDRPTLRTLSHATPPARTSLHANIACKHLGTLSRIRRGLLPLISDRGVRGCGTAMERRFARDSRM